jgi:hypothetical protein
MNPPESYGESLANTSDVIDALAEVFRDEGALDTQRDAVTFLHDQHVAAGAMSEEAFADVRRLLRAATGSGHLKTAASVVIEKNGGGRSRVLERVHRRLGTLGLDPITRRKAGGSRLDFVVTTGDYSADASRRSVAEAIEIALQGGLSVRVKNGLSEWAFAGEATADDDRTGETARAA